MRSRGTGHGDRPVDDRPSADFDDADGTVGVDAPPDAGAATNASAPADAGTLAAADPYGLDLPAGWRWWTDGGRSIYESPGGRRRIVVREFARGLTLYWWVDLHERREDGWTDAEAVGGTFDDPAEAARAASRLVAEIAGEDPDGASAAEA